MPSPAPLPIFPGMEPFDFLPSPWVLAAGVPLSALYLAATAALVGWLRTRRGVAAPYTRKVFHFAVFSAATGVHLAWGLGAVTVFGSVVAAGVLVATIRGGGDPFYEALARPSDAPRRTLFVLVPLAATAVGGVVANLFFHPWAPVGYMVAGWGDAAAEPVGTRWGRHRYRVPSLAGVRATRSLEGSAAVLVLGSAAAAATLWAMGLPPRASLSVGVACGVTATAVEAFSSHGLDNLTLQVGIAALAWVVLG